MIPVELARRLRDAGLRWEPARGDRFVIVDRDMDEQVFVLSDMTIEVHEFPTGPVIGFNGTVEWALDSVDRSQALWLPSEDQLRERLGGAFRGLVPVEGGYAVGLEVAGRPRTVRAAEPDTAYALSLLWLATGEVPAGQGQVEDGRVDDGLVEGGPIDDGRVDDGPVDDGPAEDGRGEDGGRGGVA